MDRYDAYQNALSSFEKENHSFWPYKPKHNIREGLRSNANMDDEGIQQQQVHLQNYPKKKLLRTPHHKILIWINIKAASSTQITIHDLSSNQTVHYHMDNLFNHTFPDLNIIDFTIPHLVFMVHFDNPFTTPKNMVTKTVLNNGQI